MFRRSRAAPFIGALLLLLALAAIRSADAQVPAGAAALERHPCGGDVTRALAARGVATDRLAGLFVINSLSGGRENVRFDGYEAWAQIVGQPGSIVVRLDPRCGVRDVYARDGATLPR